MSSRKPLVALDAVSSIAMLVAAVVLITGVWFRPDASSPERPRPPIPTEPLPLSGAVTIGDLTAPVGMLIFSEFQCPYCGQFAREVMPNLVDQFINDGKLLVAFRHFPLTRHALARPAAAMSMCAHEAGKFWPLHDALFAGAVRLEQPRLVEAWREVGLPGDALQACLQDEAVADRIDVDIAIGRSLAVTGTPTLFVGRIADGALHVRERFSGVQQPDVLAEAFRKANSESK